MYSEIVLLVIGAMLCTLSVVLSGYTYVQKGPTCGFYALVYGISRVMPVRKNKMVKKIIMESIDSGISQIGEIFDIRVMLALAQKYFPKADVRLISINAISDIDAALKGGFVIMPGILYQGMPHYYFLEGSEGSEYICRHGDFSKKIMVEKEQIYLRHTELSTLKYFNWDDYLKKSNNRRIKDKIGVMLLHPCLQIKLQKIENKKADKLKGRRSKLNMYKKALLIINDTCCNK